MIMRIYLISNNSLLDGINYENGTPLDIVRLIRPLSIEGEENAKNILNNKQLESVGKIYSSFHSGSLSAAKYLANLLNLNIILNDKFNDCKVGELGNKNMKMVKGLQEHDFNYKLLNGESLNNVGERINKEINNLLEENMNIAIFTHKRAILGFLLKYCKVGYNLDDNLILEYNKKVVYDDTDTSYDIYEITFDNNNLVDINVF